MLDQDNYWKKFESSGQIAYYMQFKQATPESVSAMAPMGTIAQLPPALEQETINAVHDAGAGAPRNQNG